MTTSRQCGAVLLDIEGTTTSISFVKDVLFPYAVNNVEEYLESHWEDSDCIDIVRELREQASTDVANGIVGVSLIPHSVGGDPSNERNIRQCIVDYVKLLIAEDRKVTPLKELQGHIWSNAYSNGSIKGHVFSDVRDSFANWLKRRLKIYIYSSGSVMAQELLFGHSEDGDLLKYISGHFDTCIGNKRESSSYSKIAEKIGVPPKKILFLTDIAQEAHAAVEAGMQSIIVVRPGNKELSLEETGDLTKVTSLADLTLKLADEGDDENDENTNSPPPPVKRPHK